CVELIEGHVPVGGVEVYPQRGRATDVSKDVEHEVEPLVQNANVDRRHLLGREGVHVAADGLDRVCDLRRAAVGGALEQQVLEEMAGAELVIVLVTGSDPDPEAHAHRTQRRELFRDDPETRVETRSTNTLTRRSGAGR